MNPVKSKRRKLNLEVRTTLGEPQREADLDSHSTKLSDEDLSEVAAYGKTSGCALAQ